MKNNLTKNLGLKFISLFAAFFLWLVVVNVDDPVISRTYTAIPVEVLNASVIEEEGKCYEILDGTNTINVVVTAKRSVVDQMSRDYIKATADMAAMNFLDRVPIEVRSIRYADQIESVSSRTEYLKIELEDVIDKVVPVTIEHEGIVADGYALTQIEASADQIKITGPESVVNEVVKATVHADISNINKDTLITTEVLPEDVNGNAVVDSRLVINNASIDVKFLINAIKEIPISCGYSGEPVSGYVVSGTIMTSPSSVRVMGRGENFDDMDVIYISPDAVSVDGAMADIEENVDISDYLPTGVEFADKDFVPIVKVSVSIQATQHKTITVPISNITIDNVPDGYIANMVDIGSVEVEIQGLGDTFDRFNGELAIGSIDATTLVPRMIVPEQEGAPLQTGENDGIVEFDMPLGISVVTPVRLMVIVDYVGTVPIVQAGAADALSMDTVEHDAGHQSQELHANAVVENSSESNDTGIVENHTSVVE